MKVFNQIKKYLLTIRLTNELLVYSLIGFGIIARLMPHSPNFTPIAAIALFGGTYLNRREAIVIPVIAMFVSDYFIGFHSTMIYVYASFLIIVVMGFWVKKHYSFWSILGTSLIGSLLFFFITNFGVWLSSGMYPHTLAGLSRCYLMGIPFYRGIPDEQAFLFLKNTVFSDLFYTAIFFGAYEFIRYYQKRRILWPKISNF